MKKFTFVENYVNAILNELMLPKTNGSKYINDDRRGVFNFYIVALLPLNFF